MSKIHPITALRTQRGLTKQEVATILNVSRNAVHRWENGQRKPRRDLLPAIEDRLGISAADILAFERKLFLGEAA